jgi:glycosyltransferase involved in cell wall biosynthesis
MSNDKEQYLHISSYILNDVRLDPTKKMLLSYIISLSKTSKGCYASNERFGELLNINSDGASKQISKLKRLGYIETKRLYKNSKEYRYIKVLNLSNEKNKIYNSININIVSPSNWLINKIKKTSLGRQKLFHIENGIDTNIFKPRKDFLSNEYIPLNNNKKTIIYISALAKSNIYKGFDDFLWIANNLPQNEYQIICVGAEDSYISKNIYFIKQTHDKSFIAKLISRADLLILTSSHENFPLVILEALACRTAVISYNTGGISEILDNLPNCKLVPISDRVYFLQCIKNFFSNELSYKSKPIELRLKVLERFSLKKMIDKYIGLYGDILKIN